LNQNILWKLQRRLRILLRLLNLMKKSLAKSKGYERPMNPLGSFISEQEAQLAELIEVPSELLSIFECVQIDVPYRRIGGTGDGSYVIAECNLKNALLISGGISDNNDFEYECAELGASGFQFDGSINYPPKIHPRLGFQKVFVGEKNGYLDLQSMTKVALEFANSSPSSKILKIDIEGSEWGLLADEDLTEFDQIIIEVHNLFEVVGKNGREKLRVLKNLTDNFYTIYANGNNCCGFTNIGGFPVPNVAEFSLVNRAKHMRIDNDILKPYPITNIHGKPPLQLWGLSMKRNQ